MRAGVIGLGAMGEAMATRLARTGALACVWNRTSSRGAPLAAALDVMLAADPADLGRHCDLVVVSVADDQALKASIAALMPGLRPGMVVVDTSTVAPATAQALSAELAALGVTLLDAPVSGGIEGARSGTLVAMVGGPSEALELARPLLSQLASRIVHLGPPGAGQAAKAVNQVMVAGINQAVAEGLAFGNALGLAPEPLLQVLGHGMAASRFLERRGGLMVRGEFATGFKVALHHKDLLLAQKLADALGAQLPLVEMTLIHYRRLMQEGYGADDISRLYEQKRGLFKSPRGTPEGT